MSSSETLSIDALLQQAVASHRAGQHDAAETAYRAVLGADPGHAGAHHNLGVLMMQSGRIPGGLVHLKSAMQAMPREALYVFSCSKALIAAGEPDEAQAVLDRARQSGVTDKRFETLQAQINALPRTPDAQGDVAACRLALAAAPDDPGLLDRMGSALLHLGKVEEAIESYRKAIAADPDFADGHYHLGSVLSENGRVAEGFQHYMRRAALVYGTGTRPPGDEPDPPHKVKHDLAQRDYLAGGHAAPGAAHVPDMFHLADCSRVEGPAVNPATPQLLADWRSSQPQMVVIENFLTIPALEKLRFYCAGSTVWRKLYAAGYLGAAPEDGFACPLLAQIVEEIQSSFRTILEGEPFRYLGAFKYDSDLCSGTNTHADNSRINVNFYIAPDDANLDPEHGGMEIWDLAAPNLADMRRYNSNEAAIRDLLERSGAKRTVIPHRANRAVIFRSALFHKTDAFRFRSDYLSRRINVSMLFGEFGN